MMPAVDVPKGAVRTPVEVKLKPRCRYDAKRRSFDCGDGKAFRPSGDLPKNTRIVSKAPALAAADPAALSESERDLQRYLQVILPKGESPADYVAAIRAWPSVEDAWVAPEISLPGGRAPE